MNRIVSLMAFAALFGSVGYSQTRAIPVFELSPRSADDWQALHARVTTGFPEQHPDKQGEFTRLQERMASLYARYGNNIAFDRKLADALIDELYVENGHPVLNARAQAMVVELATAAARRSAKRMNEEARAALYAGLSAYANAGGGRATPSEQAALASALCEAAPNDAPNPTADALLTDAYDWAVSVASETQQKDVVAACVRRWGDAFYLDVIPAPPTNGKEVPPKYAAALAKIRAMLITPAPSESELADRVREGAMGLESAPVEAVWQADLTTRFLAAARALIERRPAMAPRACAVLEEALIRVARRDRLTTDQHWQLWEKAIAALGEERTDDLLRKAVARLAGDADQSPAAREAAERLIERWNRGATLQPRR